MRVAGFGSMDWASDGRNMVWSSRVSAVSEVPAVRFVYSREERIGRRRR